MTIIILIIGFIFGAVFGSFVNVLIDRVPEKKSIIKVRSHCDFCHKKLLWYDMIPIISYIVLSGKCRSCKKTIPVRNLAVELLSGFGVMLLLSLFLSGQTSLVHLFLYIMLFLICVAIFFVDLEKNIIPDKFLVALTAIGIINSLFYPLGTFITHIVIALLSLLVFFGIFFVTNGRGMGFGDVKFAFVIGFLLGFPGALVAFYTAFLTGAFASIILVLGRKKKFRTGTVPFGPFLVIGVIVSLFFAQEAIAYISVLLHL